MTTINCDILSSSSVGSAVNDIGSFQMDKFDPFVKYTMLAAAESVRSSMHSAAHVRTGDLKKNIESTPLRESGKYNWYMDVNPRHVKAPDEAYAEVERSYGGDHDFTARNLDEAKAGAKEAADFYRSML